MDFARPRFAFADEIFARRPHRADAVRFAGLWVAGSLAGLDRTTVAIVGPRAPSAGGLARARDLASDLSQAGVCVVSGLALGIDGIAHVGALTGPSPTIGVLGGGHRCFFPKRNRDLAAAMIAHGGAVLSPYAPDEPARPPQFLQRNGVVAALADAVVVVEAASRSGALNTASWAAALGIDVLAFPGDVDRAVAAGCNALIRDGATLVRDATDVLEAVGLTSDAAPAPRDHPPSATDAGHADLGLRLRGALADEPRSAEELAAATQSPLSDILAALVILEMTNAIERREGTRYALRHVR